MAVIVIFLLLLLGMSLFELSKQSRSNKELHVLSDELESELLRELLIYAAILRKALARRIKILQAQSPPEALPDMTTRRALMSKT